MCIHTNGGLTKLFLEEKKTQFLEGMKEYQSTENTNHKSSYWWNVSSYTYISGKFTEHILVVNINTVLLLA